MNTRHLALLALATFWLAACTRQETVREIDWAKAALARNPDFEIVATDESAGVFTVRDTVTGTMRTLKLQDLVAAPLPPKAAPGDVAQPGAPASATPGVESPEVPDDTRETAPGDPALAAAQTTGEYEEQVLAKNSAGSPLAEGPAFEAQYCADEIPVSGGNQRTSPVLEPSSMGLPG